MRWLKPNHLYTRRSVLHKAESGVEEQEVEKELAMLENHSGGSLNQLKIVLTLSMKETKLQHC